MVTFSFKFAEWVGCGGEQQKRWSEGSKLILMVTYLEERGVGNNKNDGVRGPSIAYLPMVNLSCKFVDTQAFIILR